MTTVQIQKNSNDWLTNEIKRVILKSDNLFDLLVQSPCENSINLFKRQRNLVTSLIRNAKRECNYRKLGNNPSSKTINSELKYQLTELKIPSQTMQLNENFTSIEQLLSSEIPEYDSLVNYQFLKKILVLNSSDEYELAQKLNPLQTRNSVGHN